MSIKYLKTATVHFLDSDTKKTFPSLAKALAAAEAYVGNHACARWDDCYLYGPGNGDSSVMVRPDLDMDAFMGRAKP